MVPAMKRRLSRLCLLLLVAAHAGTALAQYKCTSASGAVSFQQMPCVGARSEEKLSVVPNGHPPPASGVAAPGAEAGVNVDKRMLAKYEHQRERDSLLQAVTSAQDDKARRVQQRLADIAGATRQFGDDPANAQALRDALVSIDSRFNALSELDDSRVKAAQAELDNFDRAPQAR